jgi:hypothetical protein
MFDVDGDAVLNAAELEQLMSALSIWIPADLGLRDTCAQRQQRNVRCGILSFRPSMPSGRLMDMAVRVVSAGHCVRSPVWSSHNHAST